MNDPQIIIVDVMVEGIGCMSNRDTSATRKSRRVFPARKRLPQQPG
jgi:hypothetical protein